MALTTTVKEAISGIIAASSGNGYMEDELSLIAEKTGLTGVERYKTEMLGDPAFKGMKRGINTAFRKLEKLLK